MANLNTLCTAFEGNQRIASGLLQDVALLAKAAVDRTGDDITPLAVLVFNDATSEVIELDWRGSPPTFAARLALQMGAQAPGSDAPNPDGQTGAGPQVDVDALTPANAAPDDAPRGRGRPRLGVVPREITLLPRHWDWLAQQPGGASVALRKLVEAARRDSEVADRQRQARAVGYKFMSTMAGHQPGFEEASRALFAGDRLGFEAQIAAWPVDVQSHLMALLVNAF